MILVITGTHEQPFERLVSAADQLALSGLDVIVQYGYARAPAAAQGVPMLATSDLRTLARKADVIVTHGGPGAMWEAFALNKIPVAAPRMKQFGEHVDDHQVAFVQHMARHRRVIPIFDPISELGNAIEQFATLSKDCILPSGRANTNRKALTAMLDAWLSGNHLA